MELEVHMLQMDGDGEAIVPSAMSSRKMFEQTSSDSFISC